VKKVFFASVFLLCFYSLSYSALDDLLAYWSFDDGTARDVTGNGYDGIKMNNPTVVPGVVGNALHFQGKGYYMLANDNPANIGDHILLPPIDLHKFKEFTISMWVYEEDFSSNYGDYYFWFGHFDRGWLGIGNHYEQYGNKFYLILQYAVNGKGFDNMVDYKFEYSFRNRWVCYTMVYKDGLVFAYADGQLLGARKAKVQYSMEHFALLRHWWLYDGEERTSARFTGAIDEIKIFKKALTEDEVKNECLSCGPMSFAYSDFNSIPSFRLLNNAYIYGNVIRLTPTFRNQTGAVWTKHLVPVALGFETTFRFRITEGNNPEHKEQHFPGADGIAFVIQNSSSFAIGNLGGGIGYDGIPNSIAIEFDTYANDSEQIENFNDPNDNHIAVLSNGINPNSSKHIFPYVRGQTTNILPLRTDGTIYYAKVEYDNFNKRLSVWLDTTQNFTNPSLEIEGFDLASELNLDGGEGAFIGFTSATGNAYENHDLLAWSFCPLSRKVYLEVEENIDAGSYIAVENSKLIIVSKQNCSADVEIFDLLGRKIYDATMWLNIGKNLIESWEYFNILNKGLYIILVKSEGDVLFKKMIMK
jgi:hypothetical protein